MGGDKDRGVETPRGKGKKRAERPQEDAVPTPKKGKGSSEGRGAAGGSGLPSSGSELAFWLSSPSVPLLDKLTACSPLLEGAWRIEGGDGGRLARVVLQFAAGALVRTTSDPAKKKVREAKETSTEARSNACKLWRLVDMALSAPPADVASVVSGFCGHMPKAVQGAAAEEDGVMEACARVLSKLKDTHQANFNPK